MTSTNTNSADSAEAIGAAAAKAAVDAEAARKAAGAQKQKQYRERKKAERREEANKELVSRCENFGLIVPEGIDTRDDGSIKDTLANCIHILESQDWGFAYDQLAQKSVFTSELKWSSHYGRELNDDLVRAIRFQMLEIWDVEFSTQQVWDSLRALCRAAPFHPILDYLDGLPEWDGTTRTSDWPSRYCGAPETELTRTFGELWLVAAVRRVKEPGCKFDSVLCLEGAGGTGKSSVFKTLGGEWHSDGTLGDIGGRYAGMNLEGVWIQELAEMAAARRAHLEDFKAFLSRWEDRYHPPHASSFVTRPRQCVFGSNSNRNDYLDDPTGYRRAWPVKCGEVNLSAPARDRDQLFAEASVLESLGMSIMLPRKLWEVAAKEQAARYVPHPWEDDLREHLERYGDTKVHASDLYDALGFDKKERTRKLAREVRAVMTRLGWEPCDSVKIGTKVSTGFKRVVPAKVPAT